MSCIGGSWTAHQEAEKVVSSTVSAAASMPLTGTMDQMHSEQAAGQLAKRGAVCTWRSPGNLVKVDVLANLLTTRVHLAGSSRAPKHQACPPSPACQSALAAAAQSPAPATRPASQHTCAQDAVRRVQPVGKACTDRRLPATIIQVANAVAQQLDDSADNAAIQAALDAAQCLLWAGCRLPGHRPQDIITSGGTSFADQTLLPLQIS